MTNPKQDTSMLDPDQVREVVSIGNETEINNDMTAIPGHVAYYGGCYADAKSRQRQVKRELEVVESQLYIEYKGATMSNGKPATDEFVKASTILDPRFTRAAQAMDAVTLHVEKVGNVCDALQTKREMLISLGANYRAEMRPSPSINGETTTSKARQRLLDSDL
jgi:hypothetical protein